MIYDKLRLVFANTSA